MSTTERKVMLGLMTRINLSNAKNGVALFNDELIKIDDKGRFYINVNKYTVEVLDNILEDINSFKDAIKREVTDGE